MPRKLYLLRHAQSADKQQGQTDMDRILTPQGIMDTQQIGQALKKNQINFDLILCSTAVRAKSTCHRLCEMLSYPIPSIHWDEHLYETTDGQILLRVNGLSSHHQWVLMVGHNPSISDALSLLTGLSFQHLGPGGIAAIHFDTEWNKVMAGSGQLEFILDPTTIH